MKLAANDIWSYASDIVQNIVYYNDSVWEYKTGKGWVDAIEYAKNTKAINNSIRGIVKRELGKIIPKGLSSLDDVKDIDAVLKEVLTDLESRRYNYKDIKQGIYFLNGFLYWDVKQDKLVFDEGNKDFTPNTVQIEFSMDKLKAIEEQVYPNTLLKRYIDNINSTHTNTIFEYMGNVLAFRHTGAALIIDGPPGIGKSTLGILVSSAFEGGVKSQNMMHMISGADLADGNDQFFLTGGINKPLWFVSESKSSISSDRVKWFNETIDDTMEQINIRTPHAASKPYPKKFNLIMATNGVIKFSTNDEETERALKQRLIVVKSESKGGILSTDQWNSLFDNEELETFIYMSVLGYERTRIAGKDRNKQFSSNDLNQWVKQSSDENTTALIVFDSLTELSQNTFLDEEVRKDLAVISDLWRNGKEVRMTNNDIKNAISHTRRIWPGEVPSKYVGSTFKRDLEKWCSREEVQFKTVFWNGEKAVNGVVIAERKSDENSDQ